ncbi:MAG: RDD family protein [Deltaproteobacteria bacterium]|nr:RDD family protein [Deltaproteobacteria bacterium]
MDKGMAYDTNQGGAGLKKAEYLERFLAKFIDFLVVGALFMIPGPVGPLAGTTYILISDGLKGGQSLGKRLIRLKALSLATGGPCDFRKSMIRNAPFALLIVFCYVVGWIPYLGPLLSVIAVVAVFGMEITLIFTDSMGARLGDRVAGTIVVDSGHGDA